jgi:uncharacterized integral membrane protein
MVMAGLSPAIIFLAKAASMLRRIIWTLIVVPLAVVIIAFAVANRQSVTVSLDPFSWTSPAYAATLPLFAIIFVVLILGVLIGGIAAWIGQTKWRRSARKLDSEVRGLHQELDAIRRRFAPEPLSAGPQEAPFTVVPPPVP